MTPIVRVGAATLVFGAVITWLLVRSLGPRDTDLVGIEWSLAQLATGDSRLHADVLSARAGLLRDYDPLVRDLAALQAGLATLPATGDAVVVAQAKAIAATIAEQETRVEAFKSDNALLQNSLAYFDLLAARLDDPATRPALSNAIGELTSSMMHLTRDASADVVSTVNSRLDQLAGEHIEADLAEDRATLELHGRLLSRLLPHVDDQLRQLLALSTTGAREAITSRLRELAGRREAIAARYRVALYLVALALLGLLVQVGLRLRAGTLALRRRADFEHVVSEVSNAFIACQPEEIRPGFAAALERLASACGAERAYVIVPGDPPDCRTWARTSLPETWPHALLEAVGDIERSSGALLSSSTPHAALPEGLKTLVARHALRHWLCTRLEHQGVLIGLLGFEASELGPSWRDQSEGPLLVSGNLFTNALLREHNAQERIALESRLQRARRLETVGTVTSGVAHNFNNVLGVIVGHAEMAADRSGPDSPAGRNIQQILRAGARARELVEQILDFGRRSETARRPLEVNALVNDTATLVRGSLPNGVSLEVTATAEGGLVLGDYTQLQQVLVNLLRNAAQASAPGSPVILSAASEHVGHHRPLSHGNLAPGSYHRVGVSDTGTGIEPETLAGLFQPFFTTRPAGTGLGLATAREVVSDMGGAFDVRSAPGRGSTFMVWLPAAAAGADATAAPPKGRGQTVMVVAGDRRMVERGEDMLAALDYEPVGFAGGAAALAAAREAPSRFELVVVDQEVGDMSGVELARRLRGLKPYPVVLIASDRASLSAGPLAAAGIVEVLGRSADSGRLATALSRVTRPVGR